MAALACAAALNAADAGAAEWEVKAVADGKAGGCLIVSAKKPISDGYQDITAQILVDSKTVAVQSDSVLDGSFSDLSVTVGKKDYIKADRIAKERQAVFESQYAELVKLFKAGLVTMVQLRFWPTWPTKGPQTAAFSLIGFTRAYDEAKCAQQQ
jgi:hypothetical protein